MYHALILFSSCLAVSKRNVRRQSGGGVGDSGGGLTRRYGSFEEFASEQFAKIGTNETLAVPIVTSPDGSSTSIPAVMVIGVQVSTKILFVRC